MRRSDLIDFVVVGLALGAVLAFRAAYVEPRVWGDACALVGRPFACEPRAALIWLQHWQLWGGTALALGLWAFLGGPSPVRVAAVAIGAIAVANYNATWGMLGLALGAWSWIGQASASAVGNR